MMVDKHDKSLYKNKSEKEVKKGKDKMIKK